MELINQIILSIVQGITEFIPVSSSGHLAILQNFLGEVDVSFDIFLHLATILAILVYFKKDLTDIVKDFFTFKTKSKNFKFALYLIIASIPAGIFGYLIKDSIDSIFSNIIFGVLKVYNQTLPPYDSISVNYVSTVYHQMFLEDCRVLIKSHRINSQHLYR